MITTLLLAIVFVIASTTAASAGPRGDPFWQPCDYSTDWRIDGTSCG
jgi:hypothetical protein